MRIDHKNVVMHIGYETEANDRKFVTVKMIEILL